METRALVNGLVCGQLFVCLGNLGNPARVTVPVPVPYTATRSAFPLTVYVSVSTFLSQTIADC
jgi:hypothetical protein